MPDWGDLDRRAVEILVDYLRINTTNPPGNEAQGAQFLFDILSQAGARPELLETQPGRAAVVARLSGSSGQPKNALGLLHHIDVVPADASEWSVDPFGGEMRDGAIWGRGAIDMKGVGVMHLIAFLALIADGTQGERDVVFIAVPDEEMGGAQGAGRLLELYPEKLACSELLNEGGYGIADTSPPVLACGLSEKALVWLRLTARGEAGHASVPPVDQAIVRLIGALAELSTRPRSLRSSPLVSRTLEAMATHPGSAWAGELAQIARGGVTADQENDSGDSHDHLLGQLSPHLRSGLLDLVTITRLDAGYKDNVVPSQATATLDVRIVNPDSIDEVIAEIKGVADRFDVEVIETFRDGPWGISDGPLLGIIQQVCEEEFTDAVFAPGLFPAFTDSRYFRSRGTDAYGLAPLFLSDSELKGFHGVDERIPVDGFLRGCRVIYEILRRAGNWCC